jgi:hypothetical protein
MPGHLGGCFGCDDAEPLFRWSAITGGMKVLCHKTNTEIVEHFGTCPAEEVCTQTEAIKNE